MKFDPSRDLTDLLMLFLLILTMKQCPKPKTLVFFLDFESSPIPLHLQSQDETYLSKYIGYLFTFVCKTPFSLVVA